MLLRLKADSIFWLHNKKERKGYRGKWSFKENLILLNCEPPPDITFLIQNLDYIQDTIFTLQVRKNKIRFNNLILKKRKN
ncbi:hypothetical protein [Aureivirga sp. CE67]|uniref:hypothetical protein n=1 Tax=Aureivirga sp. CE67 TaxID=1788983 RepID=UPI0018CA224C|nr:hypothetical protein [Aureivirga sp. CE67]